LNIMNGRPNDGCRSDSESALVVDQYVPVNMHTLIPQITSATICMSHKRAKVAVSDSSGSISLIELFGLQESVDTGPVGRSPSNCGCHSLLVPVTRAARHVAQGSFVRACYT